MRRRLFSERELTFTFAICCRPSVCRPVKHNGLAFGKPAYWVTEYRPWSLTTVRRDGFRNRVTLTSGSMDAERLLAVFTLERGQTDATERPTHAGIGKYIYIFIRNECRNYTK